MDGLWYMHVFRTHRTSTVSSCAFCEQEGWSGGSPLPLLRPRVARAQKIISFHPLLFISILLPDGRFQDDLRLHGIGNQTVRLGFLDQLLGFGRISARRKRNGRLQRDGRELKLLIDQFQLSFSRALV